MYKRTLFCLGSLVFFCLTGHGQTQSRQQKATNIGFGSQDIRYEQNLIGEGSTRKLQLSDTYSTVAWKGERVSIQIVVQANQELSNLKVNPGDLKLTDDSGHTLGQKGIIPSTAIKTGFIRYVLANGVGKSGSGCGIDTAVQHLALIKADGIDYVPDTKVGANMNQPVWLTLQIPSESLPGKYKGQLEISYSAAESGGKALKQHSQALTYEVLIKDKTLPTPSDWKFHLDLWQYPESVARFYHVKPWSDEHFSKMRPYMEMLAAAGQKVITTSIIDDPWNGQTYDPYSSMVQWTKQKDGSWRFDYSIFDKWVAYMMNNGIDKQINCYSMVPWNNKFSYYDEASGSKKSFVAKPGTGPYNDFWRVMLADFAHHLKEKGWFEKTTIAMDERPLEAMEQVIQLIKHLPEPFKISLAGSYHQSLDEDIYDYSITTREHYDSAVLSRRTKENLPTTYYTCCTEDHPNTFTFSPPAEAAFIPLLSAARDLSGYLRWAYNAWPAEPWSDSRFGSWSSGDTYFVYPGPGSSIRFEQLIRGIQDYEKIQLIKKALLSNNDHDSLDDLEQVLNSCTLDALKNNGASKMVQSVESAINKF